MKNNIYQIYIEDNFQIKRPFQFCSKTFGLAREKKLISASKLLSNLYL